MIKSTFTVHEHYRRRQHGTHWDLRVLRPDKRYCWSWALPKERFPEPGEKLLTIQTPDHPNSILTLQGTLEDAGDRMKIVDTGECEIILNKPTHRSILFNGKKIKGLYVFVYLANKQWLMLASKKDKDVASKR